MIMRDSRGEKKGSSMSKIRNVQIGNQRRMHPTLKAFEEPAGSCH